ncbi:MAG: CotH kinase family protein, partial [Oscillospiraceae bacterium]
VDAEQVIRYFVAHNFLCNGDSYTGSMIHNYYLYEEDGRLSMIPWDYNLAFGTFQGSNAKEQVNYPIDTPVSGGMDDRPMIAWIFASEEYTALYHKLFVEFLSQTDFSALISDTAELIAEYVEKDPTKFCTYEEFEAGVSAITQFCTLRAQSVSGQLDGSIPSTSDGQSSDSSSLVDTGSLVLSDMGSMNMGGGDFGGDRKEFGRNPFEQNDSENNSEQMSDINVPQMNGEKPTDLPQDNMDGSQKFPQNNNKPADEENADVQASATVKPNSDNNGERPSDNQNGGFAPENNAPQLNQETPKSPVNNTLILSVISVAVLAAGLLIAFFYKR